MKRLQLPFQGLGLIMSVLLLVGSSACSGKKEKADTDNIRKESKITPLDSNLEDTESTGRSHLPSFQLLNSGNQISDVVRTVFQDSKEDLWFGTQNGAFKYNGTSFIHMDSITTELGHGVTIKDIIEDKDGNIWFGHTGGISVFDGKSTINYYESDGLLSNDVWCITFDKQNQLWIGTIEGVSKFDGSHFTAFEIPEGKIDNTRGISSTKVIHDILEDSQGRLWFSTNGGIYIKDNDDLSHISEKDGLQTSFVNQVIEDKQGNFWISTSKGLFHYADKTLKNVTEGMITNFKGTGSILEDSKGYIWFNPNLSAIYSFYQGNFAKYKIAEGDDGPAPFQIYEDRQGRLWFVGFGGAYRYENEEFINITQQGPF